MPDGNTSSEGAPQNAGMPRLEGRASGMGWDKLAGIAAVVALVALGAFAYTFTSSPKEDVRAKPVKIGIAYFRQGLSSIEGLKKKLAELGYSNVTYVEEEIVIGPKLDADTEKALTKMILEDKVDLIWEDHEFQAKTALAVTAKLDRQDIQVVFLSRFHNPVAYGLAASFKSSGNNLTGVVEDLATVAQRDLGFLREIDPAVKKVGIFSDGFMVPGISDEYLVHLKEQTQKSGFQLIEYTTKVPPPEAERVWHEMADAIKPGDIDALMHLPGHFYNPQEYAEYDLAKRLGIPHSVPYEDLDGGGHFAYSSNFAASGEQSAIMVDKILQGAKPSDIPIEYGETSRLELNLKRAQETGITFSDSMLYIATEQRDE